MRRGICLHALRTAAGSTAVSATAMLPDAARWTAATPNRIVRKRWSSALDDRTSRRYPRRDDWLSSLRQCEHRQRAAERGIIAQRRIAAHRAETRGRIGQARRKPDARPAADPGQHRNELPPALLVGRDVADDA